MNPKFSHPVLAALALPLLAASASGQMTGVSHPDQAPTQTQETAPASQPAPAAADHYVMPSHVSSASTAYPATAYPGTGEPVSYAATGPVPATSPAAAPVQAPAGPVLLPRQPEQASAPTAYAASAAPAGFNRTDAAEAGDDSGIVTAVPARPYELPAGTVLKTRLDLVLGTDQTPVGTPFTAQLLADAEHGGQVLLPVGSVVHGHVTSAHGGKRLTGGAALHLEPQTVTLPDGTSYPLTATLSDVEGSEIVHVNSEGTIRSATDGKAVAAVLGGTTAVAAVTGAVVGGGVGALVGAGIGAGVGTVVWLRQDHQATLPAGTMLYFALNGPLQLNPR